MTTDNRFVQFTNTKMCRFHILGKCKKGRECPFAHTSKELRNLPDLRCTKLCKSFVLTGICADAECTYAHSKEELRTTNASRKTKMCRFKQTGYCTLGAKCNFAHSTEELRQPENDLANLVEGSPLPPGVMYPPGLEPKGPPVYQPFTETVASDNEVSELCSLAQAANAFEMMLSMQGQGETGFKAAEEAPAPKPNNLASDSPAYVRLSSVPHGVASTVTCQPVKTSSQLGKLNLDYLRGDDLSLSTQSPASSEEPPSPTGSSSSSTKRSNPALVAGSIFRNYLGSEAVGLGCYDTAGHSPQMLEPSFEGNPYMLPGPYGQSMFTDHTIFGA